jgi:CMP-N-acetylneuraminic acid synthetase
MGNIAIILAREGSIRLKNKNRRKINGISLVDWSINFAKKINFLNDIIVSSDDQKILKKYINNSIIVINRPKFLSKKESSSEDAIIHAASEYEKKNRKIDSILLLQPTSPFRSLQAVNYAFKKYNYFKKKKSIISVSKSKNKSKKKYYIKGNNLTYLPSKNKNYYQIDGNFYIASLKFLKKYKSFFYKNKSHPIINKYKKFSVDIDTIDDFKKAKKYLKK